MSRFSLISITALLFLTACSNEKKPNDENFKKAINQYLAKHGKACTSIGRDFPVDVPEAVLKDQYRTGSQMAALEEGGLVHSSDTIAPSSGILGLNLSRRVRRYELTDEGKKYFQEIPGVFGQTGSFCYGEKTVDSIVRWTEPAPMEGSSKIEVIYTYKIVNLALWAERPDVQHAFGDIRTTLNGVSKANQDAGLQLTNQGWEVPGQEVH
jgi:hypothetical protein